MICISWGCVSFFCHIRGYRGGSPPPFRPSEPALCRSCPLVTPYYCRLGDLCFVFIVWLGGTAAAAPPPFRPGNPALCGSHPLVTPYYCRLGGLCFVFIVRLLCFSVIDVLYVSLQYFDTVGWVFWPVKAVSHITYILCWRVRKTLLHPSIFCHITCAFQKPVVRGCSCNTSCWQ